MKRWLLHAGQAALGAFIGSLALENLTRLTIWQIVPRVHDVQFALLITFISTVGGVLSGVVVVALILTRVQSFKLAGSLLVSFGALATALSLLQIIQAPQTFDDNSQPFIDALAYVGFTLVFSITLLLWGVVLLFKRSTKAV